MGETPGAKGAQSEERRPETDEGLEDLLAFIRDSRGFDFTGYKRTSLARRVHKRMREIGIEDWEDYRDRLERDADEFRMLFNTILINVTSFFRDRESWRFLQHEVLPRVVADVEAGAEIRIWSAGCASGEEPYSLAIMCAEALGLDEFLVRVKIYATDVDDEALRDARAGVYAARDLESLAPDLRDRYLEPSAAGFAVRPDLRRRVIFGRHDLTRDAPISRLDLLVCRNALMYFNAETQAQIVDRLHFALRDKGFLFLGKAEMLLADGERFEVLNMRHRVFRKRSGGATLPPSPVRITLQPAVRSGARAASGQREVLELMLEGSPNAVVALDTNGVLLNASTQARTDFGITAHDLGRPFRDHELSCRPAELRSLIDQAHHERRTIGLSQVERDPSSADPKFYDIYVQPLWGDDGTSAGTAITFVDTTLQTRQAMELERIREELETTNEQLQSTTEELETTNEQLQLSIEELETANEQLQSSIEELEATTEELHSGNEELETMSEEMRIRTAELDESRIFLEGVLSSVSAGVVVLGAEARVQGWNRGAEEMWGLRLSEVMGRPFFQLDFGLPTADLREVVEQVLTTREPSAPLQSHAVNRRGRAILCSVTCSPLDGPADGVVLLMEQSEPPDA